MRMRFALVLSLFVLAGGPATFAQQPAAGANTRLSELEQRIRALEAALSALRAQFGASAGEATGLAAIEARLAALEAGTRELAVEAARLRAEAEAEKAAQAELADAVDRAAQAEAEKLDLSVYGALDVSAYEGQDAEFDGKAFELVISGRPHKRLGVFAEVEFEQAAGVGGARGGEVVVEQAYANLVFTPAFNVRGGILLVPFGNVNLDHFAPRRDLVNKPLPSRAIAPSDWTDNGLGLYGRIDAGPDWRIGYEAYAVAGLGEPIDARGTRAARLGYGADNNANKALVGRVAVSRLSRLELGVSGYQGRYDAAGEQALAGYAVDALVTFGPLRLSGEYDQMRAEKAQGADVDMNGGFGRATVTLPKGWVPTILGRDIDEPALQLVGQYDWVSLAGPGPQGVVEENRERRVTLGLNYRPARQLVLKFDYEFAKVFGNPVVTGGADGFVGSLGFVF
jgi:hypothetical protein